MALSGADRLAILELAARYNQLMDWGDAAGWADCFTPNVVFHVVFNGGPKLQARGRGELIAFMQRLVARDRPARHWTNNAIIEGDGAAARLTLYLLVVDVTRDGPRPSHLGVYHDELVRTADGWRFQERRLRHR